MTRAMTILFVCWLLLAWWLASAAPLLTPRQAGAPKGKAMALTVTTNSVSTNLIIVSWDSETLSLQSTTNLLGSWSTVQTWGWPTNYVATNNGTAQFFRLVVTNGTNLFYTGNL